MESDPLSVAASPRHLSPEGRGTQVLLGQRSAETVLSRNDDEPAQELVIAEHEFGGLGSSPLRGEVARRSRDGEGLLRPHLIIATLRKSALAIDQGMLSRSMQKQREAGKRSTIVIPTKRACERRAGIQSVTLEMFRNGSRTAAFRFALSGFRDDAGFSCRRCLMTYRALPTMPDGPRARQASSGRRTDGSRWAAGPPASAGP